MNNLISELKKVADQAKEENASFIAIRVRLKEVLHYFVLDCIYNSEFKGLIFYGGTCLRILYDLPRLSEDLDFESKEGVDFQKLAQKLEECFTKNLQVQTKVRPNSNQAGNICRISLSLIPGP